MDRASYDNMVLGTVGLVGYWRCTESAGTVCLDAVSGNHMTYVNSPTLGVVGPMTFPSTAVQLDGSNQRAALSLPILTATDNFTLEAWCKPNTPSGATMLIAPGEWVTTANGYGIWIDSSLHPRGLTGTGSGMTDAGTALVDQVWSLVHLRRFNGVNSVWINGVQADPKTGNTFIAGAPQGHCYIGSYNGDSYFWKGALQRCALYNRPLADLELGYHARVGRGF